jgi:hypothetical protein
MRNTAFVVLMVIVSACTPTEKVAETTNITPFIPVDQSLSGGDSLYNIIDRHGYGIGNPGRVTVKVLSRHVVDISRPDAPGNYIGALIVVEGIDESTQQADHEVSIAVFDPANNMRLLGITKPDFPDASTLYYKEGVRVSGQGPDLLTSTLRLADGGDVMAITAKSVKQYLEGSDEDEDVWLFALWKNEVVMLMGYSRKFHHVLTGNEGWSEVTWWSAELMVDEIRARGMRDIVLICNRKVASDTRGRDEDTNTVQRYIFNGKEYIQQ